MHLSVPLSFQIKSKSLLITGLVLIVLVFMVSFLGHIDYPDNKVVEPRRTQENNVLSMVPVMEDFPETKVEVICSA